MIPFDYYAWPLADPEHWTGIRPLAHPPDPANVTTLIRWKYLTPTNRWTVLGSRARPVASLLQETGGQPERSELWNRVLRDAGVIDAASVCFSERFGVWGWLDLWRTRGSGFEPSELDLLAALVPESATSLRRCIAVRFDAAVPAEPWTVRQAPAQGVVLLSDGLEVTGLNAAAEQWQGLLVPPPNRSVSAEVFNVAAQLLAREAGVDARDPVSRVPIGAGRWATLNASRMLRSRGGGAGIAVTIERCPSSALLGIYLRSHGLTPRERELVRLLARGLDPAALARRLGITECTVQDHLKSVFAKTGVHGRGELLAHALGGDEAQ